MKYAVLTFGCRVNQADSFDLERILRSHEGVAASPECADLVVVNTCSVTGSAEQAARQAIRRVARLNPSARILATGCYAARRPADLATLPVSGVVKDRGADAARQVLSILPTAPGTVETEPRPGLGGGPIDHAPIPEPGTRGRTLYLLRAQTGCDEACTYCVVPETRGSSRSVPLAALCEQVSAVAAAGFTEVMVTGVHLGAYGRDLRPASSLGELIGALSRHPAPVGFRLSAIEPMDMSRAVVDRIAASDRFAHHFHLPLQHASDRVLSAMGRPYGLDGYRGVVDRVRERFPDAAIGSDFIVGFPGESEADFEACVEYLETSPLTYAHVFPFSSRPGTAAASLVGRPHPSEVRRRVTRLREVARDVNARFRARFIGHALEGLTIGDGSLVMTSNYLTVRIQRGLPRNRRVKVRVVADGNPMMGTLVQA